MHPLAVDAIDLRAVEPLETDPSFARVHEDDDPLKEANEDEQGEQAAYGEVRAVPRPKNIGFPNAAVNESCQPPKRPK